MKVINQFCEIQTNKPRQAVIYLFSYTLQINTFFCPCRTLTCESCVRNREVNGNLTQNFIYLLCLLQFPFPFSRFASLMIYLFNFCSFLFLSGMLDRYSCAKIKQLKQNGNICLTFMGQQGVRRLLRFKCVKFRVSSGRCNKSVVIGDLL